jgi:maltose alpha-D-glucosyltransferase/alpha-amylase
VGDLPYMLTLSAYGFFWFALSDDQSMPSWHDQLPDILPEFMTLTSRDGHVSTALAGREGQQFQNDVLAQWLPRQRWFAAKDVPLDAVELVQLGNLGDGAHALVRLDIALRDGEQQSYFLPISARWGEENLRPGAPKLSWTMAKIRHTARMGALVDGAFDDTLPQLLLDGIKQGITKGALEFRGTDALCEIEDHGPPRQLGVDQSNLSIAFSDKIILKLYRRLRAGDQPDVEVPQFLTEVAGYAHTPQYLGHIAYRDPDATTQQATTLAAAFAFVANRGDAWAGIIDALTLDVNEQETWTSAGTAAGDPAPDQPGFGFPLAIGGLLGQRTAELHCALATDTDNPAFQLERLTQDRLRQWSRDATSEAESMFARLDATRLPDDAADLARNVLAQRDTLLARLRDAGDLTPSGHVSRIHGDYHLGQVLLAQNDIAIIDFEGEPARTLDERRAKSSPLRDVAGMLRSIDYAALSVATRYRAGFGGSDDHVFSRVEDWRRSTRSAFLQNYWDYAKDTPNLPRDAGVTRQLLDLFALQKAVYEVGYELGNRPEWVGIPLRGILDLLDTDSS